MQTENKKGFQVKDLIVTALLSLKCYNKVVTEVANKI